MKIYMKNYLQLKRKIVKFANNTIDREKIASIAKFSDILNKLVDHLTKSHGELEFHDFLESDVQ